MRKLRENHNRRGSTRRSGAQRRGVRRSGLASLDYVLIIGILLPLVAFVMAIAPRITQLAFEMVCVLVAWPFM